MNKIKPESDKTEKYVARLFLGLFLGFAVFYVKAYVENHGLVEKIQSRHGLYYSFDLFYYGFFFIGLGVSVLLIIPSIIFFII